MELSEPEVGLLRWSTPEMHGDVDLAAFELPFVKEAQAGAQEGDDGGRRVPFPGRGGGPRLVVVLEKARAALLEGEVRPEGRRVRVDGERFDLLPLLVATDGAIAAFGHDRRRLRPNLVIGGVDGMAEREWPSSRLRVGNMLIGVEQLRQRCIMTSFVPDTLVQDRNVTRSIFERFEGTLALDCFVIEVGEISVGDAVHGMPGHSGSRVEGT